MKKIFVWLMRLVVFLAILWLAIKNSDPVDLHFYLDNTWQAPLSAVILLSFVAGIIIGLAVASFMLIRQKRELRRLRKQASAAEAVTETKTQVQVQQEQQ
jgi:uncharacterized integral membrane protein